MSSEVETANLIDLNIEDEPSSQPQLLTETPANIKTIPSTITTRNPSEEDDLFNCSMISPLLQTRLSIDNNPFDSVQKLAIKANDPFEIAEQQACVQARRSIMPSVEVKLGNLLSLSDDNLLDDETTDSENMPTSSEENTLNLPKFYSDSSAAMTSGCSTIYHSAVSNELQSETPPISMSFKLTPESINSASESGDISASASSTDGGAGYSAKTKKSLEYRKRLLKLSLSNSTFNSPVSRRQPSHNEGFGSLGGEDNCNGCSPLSTLFFEAAHGGENMLAAESPLKLVDDDLLMSEEQPVLIDSEKEFDADLEMLRIPMLKQLPSAIVEDPVFPREKVDGSQSTATQLNKKATLINLDAIRSKLRAKREEANNNQDISLLIQDLRSLICNIGNVDDKNKLHASSLLETLSTALASGHKDESPKVQSELTMSTLPAPQPIVRQGTFDIELQENSEKHEKEMSPGETISSGGQSPHKTHSVQPNPTFEEIPDIMFASAATYDGETGEEKGDLILPEVEPLSPPSQPPPLPLSPPQAPPSHVQDIIEQLSRLLDQHHITQQMQSDSSGVGGAFGTSGTSTSTNPTFIVVMNTQTPHMPTDADTHLPTAKERSAYVAQYMESSFTDGSPDLANSSTMMRRRSQSLSIHDKVKIVQIQMPPPHQVSVEQEDSPPVGTPPTDTEGLEFKTPSRMMLRRNSFSSGTPYTPRPTSNFGRRSNASELLSKTPAHMRRSGVLETHHERQQHAIVRPMPMPPQAILNSFKPDLKKKYKSSTLTDSIMKSSGPLKATIPVKKVAPMLKTLPPTPDGNDFSSSTHKSSLNSSMHLLTKSGKMAYTSTPMPLSRSTGALGASANGYPNACSTPTVRHSSPMKRTGMHKPRYSCLSVTPTAKPVTPSAAAAGLKRRTLTELRTKSPVKTRLSTIGAGTGKFPARPITKLPSPTGARAAHKIQASSTSGRAATRLSSRASISGSAITYKNKENKLP